MPPTRFAALLVGLGLATAGPALAADETMHSDDSAVLALQQLDTDHDGSIDAAESEAAASAIFAKLDPDHNGTLGAGTLAGRIDTAANMSLADPDHDGTVSKAEYLAYVDGWFKKIDTNHDGKVDRGELATPNGETYLQLVK